VKFKEVISNTTIHRLPGIRYPILRAGMDWSACNAPAAAAVV